MGQLSKKFRSIDGGKMGYWCQGCETLHMVRVDGEQHPKWSWNGDLEKPTFTPSVLVTGRDFTKKGWADYNAWRESGNPKPVPTFESANTCCHTFITNGMVQFLGDCTHELAGQILPLPDLPPEWIEEEQP